ncbi:hypothetical protein [Sphingomonas koreensis]
MNTSDLINHFSSQASLPVDVNAVLAVLKENGCDDKIEFIGVDLDIEILQGKIKIFYVRDGVYSEPERWANIYYHQGHDSGWQRFICCKELLHLMDPVTAQTSSPEAIELLAEKIGLPPEMQDPVADGVATNVDRMAEWRAAAILLPLDSRNILLEPFKQGLLTLDDIARMADIPRRYVGLVMSPIWERVHDILAQ